MRIMRTKLVVAKLECLGLVKRAFGLKVHLAWCPASAASVDTANWRRALPIWPCRSFVTAIPISGRRNKLRHLKMAAARTSESSLNKPVRASGFLVLTLALRYTKDWVLTLSVWQVHAMVGPPRGFFFAHMNTPAVSRPMCSTRPPSQARPLQVFRSSRDTSTARRHGVAIQSFACEMPLSGQFVLSSTTNIEKKACFSWQIST